ncbi:hypothetical protein UlMin_005971 [Ulmus minor]
MKGIDIFCASQASTAICLSMDQASSSSSSTIQLGGKAIDRHNPIIRDERRGGGRVLPTPPCSSSQPPINPKSYHQLQKTKRSSTTKVKDQSKKSSSKQNDQKKKTSSGDHIKTISSSSSKPSDDDDVGRKSSAKAVDLVTPPGSSRYLLNDTAFLDGLSDYDPVLALVPFGHKKNQDQPTNATKDTKPSSSNQVVVLRVSLHCKGCEGKVRKHLSRMEGVSSFNIDYAAKKVTVVGDVTPLSVLASISKVKNAQFWPAPSASSGSNIKTKSK